MCESVSISTGLYHRLQGLCHTVQLIHREGGSSLIRCAVHVVTRISRIVGIAFFSFREIIVNG